MLIFKRKDNTLSTNAFICGYVEVFKIDRNNHLTLSLDGTWHIQGFHNGKSVWEVLDRNRQEEARRRFRALCTPMKKEQKAEQQRNKVIQKLGWGI